MERDIHRLCPYWRAACLGDKGWLWPVSSRYSYKNANPTWRWGHSGAPSDWAASTHACPISTQVILRQLFTFSCVLPSEMCVYLACSHPKVLDPDLRVAASIHKSTTCPTAPHRYPPQPPKPLSNLSYPTPYPYYIHIVREREHRSWDRYLWKTVIRGMCTNIFPFSSVCTCVIPPIQFWSCSL